MCSILEAVQECFSLVGCVQVAAEVKNSIVIVQRQGFEQTVQLLKAVANLRRIRFMGFLISLVELIQDGFAVAGACIKGMTANIGIQCGGKRFHDNTPKKVFVMLTLVGMKVKSCFQNLDG